MTTGRAAVLVAPNQIEIRDVPVTDPEPGGLLVRSVVGGVCGSDAHISSGAAGEFPFAIILGHEGVGRIEKLGAGVTHDYASTPVAEGDLVYWAPIALCGRCYTCAILQSTPCENSAFFEDASKPNWGTHQDYVWLPNKTAFFKLASGADHLALAALGCALPTALMAFDQIRPVQYQDTVVIQGAGPVGLAATMLASVGGARDVIVIDSSPQRLEHATRMGATVTISMGDLDAEQRKAKVMEVAGPAGPQIVLEATGSMDAFREGIDLTGSYGSYNVVGLWGQVGERSVPPCDVTNKNMTIGGATFPKTRHYYQAVQLAERLQDRVPLAELITHRFAIGDEAKAIHAVESGEAVKAIIDPSL